MYSFESAVIAALILQTLLLIFLLSLQVSDKFKKYTKKCEILLVVNMILGILLGTIMALLINN